MKRFDGRPTLKIADCCMVDASQTTSIRRAYVTLLARGFGSYIAPRHEQDPAVPDYVSTALPLLCSFRLIQSAYPLVILASNLSSHEVDTLRWHGADEVVDITPRVTQSASFAQQSSYTSSAAAAHARQGIRQSNRRQPASCLLSKSWMIWGRSDFAETMLKTAVWRELAGRFDEVAFIDADTLLLTGRPSPDVLFEALSPWEPPRGADKRPLWWIGGDSRCGAPREMLRLPFCDRLAFVAAASRREFDARSREPNRTACHINGWQSGFFLTRPAVHVAESLEERAAAGNFSLYTRTEQDVLDAEFEPYQACACGRACPRRPLPPHSWCARQAILSEAVRRVHLNHHKIHAYRTADHHQQAAGGYIREESVARGNTLLRNLTLTLCANQSALERTGLPASAAHLLPFSSKAFHTLQQQALALVEEASGTR